MRLVRLIAISFVLLGFGSVSFHVIRATNRPIQSLMTNTPNQPQLLENILMD